MAKNHQKPANSLDDKCLNTIRTGQPGDGRLRDDGGKCCEDRFAAVGPLA